WLLGRGGGESGGEAGGVGASRGGGGGAARARSVAWREGHGGSARRARRAGARITRQASETFYGGYAGGFRDLDGHVWEIAHNPGFPLRPDGSVVVGDATEPSEGEPA